MEKTVTLEVVKVTKNTKVFGQKATGEAPLIQSLYLPNWAGFGDKITVTIKDSQ